MGTKRTVKLILTVAGLVLVCFVWAVAKVYPKHLCSASKNIDIGAGRERHMICVLGIRIVDRSKETRLSGIYREVVGKAPARDWRMIHSKF